MKSPPGALDFDAFVAARQAALLRVAYLLTQDSARAEDLVQDALVKAYRHWPRVMAADRPEAYVRTMVVNEFLSWRRRRSSSEVAGPVPELPGGEDAVMEIVHREVIWSVLATLPRRQRVVLVLRYYEALPDREIAVHLGCAESSVRSLATRAFAVLREHPGLRAEVPRPPAAGSPRPAPPGTKPPARRSA